MNRKVLKNTCFVVLLLIATVITLLRLRSIRKEGESVELVVENGWQIQILVEGETIDLKPESTLPFTLLNKNSEEEVQGLSTNFNGAESFEGSPLVPGTMGNRMYYYWLDLEPGFHVWQVKSKAPVHFKLGYGILGIWAEQQDPVHIRVIAIPTGSLIVRETLRNLFLFVGIGLLLLKLPEVVKVTWNKGRKISVLKNFFFLLFFLSLIVVIVISFLQLRPKMFASNEVFQVSPWWKVKVIVSRIVGTHVPSDDVYLSMVSVRGSEDYTFTLQESIIGNPACLTSSSFPPEYHSEAFVTDLTSRTTHEEALTGRVYYSSGLLLCEGEYVWLLESNSKVFMRMDNRATIFVEPTSKAVFLIFLRNLGYVFSINLVIMISLILIVKVRIRKK